MVLGTRNNSGTSDDEVDDEVDNFVNTPHKCGPNRKYKAFIYTYIYIKSHKVN